MSRDVRSPEGLAIGESYCENTKIKKNFLPMIQYFLLSSRIIFKTFLNYENLTLKKLINTAEEKNY